MSCKEVLYCSGFTTDISHVCQTAVRRICSWQKKSGQAKGINPPGWIYPPPYAHLSSFPANPFVIRNAGAVILDACLCI